MNATFINEVLKQLEGKFDEKQLKTIERTLYRCLKNKEIREKKVVLPKDNNEALDFFIAAKKIEGCSIKSLNYYYTTLVKMFGKIDVIYFSITTEDIRSYLSDYQEHSGVSKATIDNMRRIISSFFSWLENEDYIMKSPARRIKKVRVGKIVKEIYTEENIELMRQNCKNARDLAIIDMLYSTGMRVGELVRLNISDIDFENKECVVLGKGNKQRKVYFDAKTKIHLQQYLNSRKDTDPALFVLIQFLHILTQLRIFVKKFTLIKMKK